MPFLRVEDTTLFYEKKESKPDRDVILLIHGLGSNNNIWDFLPQAIYKRFNFIRIDLPGHGKSVPFNSHFSIKRCAQIAERFLEKINYSNVYITGLSMGGAIALQLATDFPERLKGMILVSGWSFCDEDLKVRLESYINTANNFGVEALIDRLILPRDFTRDFSLQNPNILYKYKGMKAQQSKEAYVASCQACMEFDVRESLGSIEIPIFLMAGDRDVLTPPYHSKFIFENTRNSKLVVFSDCGHIPFIEKPKEFASHFKGFLDGMGEE